MGTAKQIRVLIVDDHRILRDALRSLLETAEGIELAGEAGDAVTGIGLAAQVRPDVIVLDIGMEGISGIQAAHRLRKQAPSSRVLIMSQYDDQEYVLEALGHAGAAGYLLKTDAAPELLGAIRAVAAGKRYISPSVAPIVLERMGSRDGRAAPDTPKLTRREGEVLRLIAQGASGKAIAQSLGISPKTVQVHRGNLAAKLHLTSTADLVRYAIRHKLTRLD